MPTSSRMVARQVLEGLLASGVDMALIHGLASLRDGSLSDLDVVIDLPIARLLATARPSWAANGIFPVIVWPYDVGGTTVFLATHDASDGVQLDLLHDRKGSGKLGVRSQPLLAHSHRLGLIPTVDDPYRLTYLWKKRLMKRQSDRLSTLKHEALGVDREALESASVELTGNLLVARQLEGRMTPSRAPSSGARVVSEARRRVKRILTPIGFWIHVDDSFVGAEVVRRFGRFLAAARLIGTPPRVGVKRALTEVVPVVFRPGLVVTTGSSVGTRLVRVVEGSDPIQVSVDAVRLMTSRLP
jgi:hypothetical protein